MRVYLVIMDETEEAAKAVRYASQRALAVGARLHILALVTPQNFNAFGGVQATIEQEARDRAEALAMSAAGAMFDESGRMPTIAVREGEGQSVIREYLTDNPAVAALVLGAAESSNPGPLVSHFSGASGQLPCPLIIVPGGLSDNQIDTLSAEN